MPRGLLFTVYLQNVGFATFKWFPLDLRTCGGVYWTKNRSDGVSKNCGNQRPGAAGTTAIFFGLVPAFPSQGSAHREERCLIDAFVLPFPFSQMLCFLLAWVQLVMNVWICFGFGGQTWDMMLRMEYFWMSWVSVLLWQLLKYIRNMPDSF